MTKRAAWALITLVMACSGGGGEGSGDGDGGLSDGRTTDGPAGDGPATDAVITDAVVPGRDPALPGDWQVRTEDNVSIRLSATVTVRGTVFSPSTDGTTPAPGPFPLVIVSPGFQLARSQYAVYCRHLATWGYLCITRDYAASGNHQAKAREVGQVIDWATGATSGLAARIDAGKIATAGHSLGGKVSINAAVLDARVKAVVGWDPVDALPPFGNDGSLSVTPEMMGGLRVPVAVLGELTDSTGGLGGQSCAPAADNYQQFFVAACQAPARLEVTIDMADHMDWLGDRASCGLACLACQNGPTTEATVQTITRRVTTAWLERHLRGDTSVTTWLAAPAVGTPASVRTTASGC